MTTTWDLQEKSGAGWAYDEPNMEYDFALDPDGGDPVFYNAVGTGNTFTLQTKN